MPRDDSEAVRRRPIRCAIYTDDLLAFPKDARKEAGFQLGKVQAGLEPADWKPFDDVGAGAREIRIREASGFFRVM